jgi:hypothetical protein
VERPTLPAAPTALETAMPTFPSPTPARVVVDLPVGTLHVVAGDRDDVVVTVLPADPAKPRDVRTAEEVQVAQHGDAVTVSLVRWKQYLPFSGTPAVTVELPAGSTVTGTASTLFTEGPLAAVEMAVTAGDARIEDVGRLDVKAGAGAVVIGRTTGPAHVRASAGSVRIGETSGEAHVRCTNGGTAIGTVTGTLDVHGAHGDVVVDRVDGSLTARTASGSVRVDRVEAGAVTLTTSYGSIEVGVPDGTAAWLDVASEHGAVRNRLTPAEGPVAEERTAEVHAGTGYGDVIVRRP